MIRRLTAAAAAALLLTAAPLPASAQARATPGAEDRLEVSGEGRVPVKPDIMYVRSGVEVRQAKAGDAYQAVAKAATRLVKVITDSGVAAKDIRTDELSVQPEYTDEQPGKPRAISGYLGTERIFATVRDLPNAHVTLNAIMAAGDDVELDSVTFDKDDSSAELAAAEKLAFADAKAKAVQRAKMIGRRLGRVITMSASTVDPIPMHFIPKAAIAEANGNLSPGEGVARVSVSVTYALL
ncbi:SIMPL domain-containing protein [Actinomadura barringtoniae]|uniref:SIMPL domain-containing protein n=1 Tax=Actinomadura barringtoniae TaxID=1427535 RepID=A0A939TDS3_9ACTN|nr:SIMPL domain-containing protein [Actinomadura barringtoniae]MBO2452590.1 SIMPL domain-containing protein [Actinomadura barringtoniae]